MKPEMIELLKDLADVLEKHGGGLTYTTSDDGVWVSLKGDFKTMACIEWPTNGDVTEIRRIIMANAPSQQQTSYRSAADAG